MVAQSATAAFLFGAGDVIAQQAIERQGKNHDVSTGATASVDRVDHPTSAHEKFMRTARLTFYGGKGPHDDLQLRIMLNFIRSTIWTGLDKMVPASQSY